MCNKSEVEQSLQKPWRFFDSNECFLPHERTKRQQGVELQIVLSSCTCFQTNEWRVMYLLKQLSIDDDDGDDNSDDDDNDDGDDGDGADFYRYHYRARHSSQNNSGDQ